MPALGLALGLGFARGAVGSVPAPTNLIATPINSSRIDVEWDEVGGATYNIYRGLAADSMFLLAAGHGDLVYSDNTVVVGTLYFYAVKAVINSEESAFSNVDSATPVL